MTSWEWHTFWNVKLNLYNLHSNLTNLALFFLIDKKMCSFYRNMENLDHIRTQTFDFFFASSSSSFLFNSFWWTCKIKNLSQLFQTKFPRCFMTKKLNNSMQSNLPMWSPLLSDHLYLKVTLVFHGQKVENQAYLLMWSPLLSSHLYLKVTFSYPVREDFIWTEPFLRGYLSYKATFSLSQRWPLNTGLIVIHSSSFY